MKANKKQLHKLTKNVHMMLTELFKQCSCPGSVINMHLWTVIFIGTKWCITQIKHNKLKDVHLANDTIWFGEVWQTSVDIHLKTYITHPDGISKQVCFIWLISISANLNGWMTYLFPNNNK